MSLHRDFYGALGVLVRVGANDTLCYLRDLAQELEAECPEPDDEPGLLRLCQDSEGFWRLCAHQRERCYKTRREWVFVATEECDP